MSATNSNTASSSVRRRSGRWWLAAFFVGWTALAALAIAWFISDAADLGNAVIKVGSGEAKSWSEHVHETISLARLNFPWALAWFFLTPYALWVGLRFSFDAPRWRSRLAVLLISGAAFVCASQWLAHRLVAGQRMIVMVRYSADTRFAPFHSADAPLTGRPSRVIVTNLVTTNRVTKVMISDDGGLPADHSELEIAASGVLSELGTNLSEVFTRHALKDLPVPPPARPNRWSAVLDAFAFFALLGLAHAGVFYQRYREREQQAAALESRLNEARLRALQAQLQPHFLFNSLNSIATLLRRDPATAGEMLQSLSELLRIALSTSERQEITLREELDFLSRYLAIQRMRFGDRLNVVEEIDPATLDCLVPALLLQPLVENAIRHGLEPSGQPGTLRLTVAREGDRLRLAVEDNGVGFTAGTEREGAGVGLANVRERLATLYGNAQEFQITERPEGGVSVVIGLPARTEAVTSEQKEAEIA